MFKALLAEEMVEGGTRARPFLTPDEIVGLQGLQRRMPAPQQGVTRRQIDDEEIVERTLYTMVNEGAKILEEGMAQRASDIDVVWVYGYGWPVYRGGPMFWADTEGLAKIIAGLEKHGFEVSKLLRDKAEKGEKLSKG